MGYLLSLSKANTTAALEISEWALLVFGLLLAVGIIGEIGVNKRNKWFRRSEVMVLVGVLGELASDGGIFLLSSRLQSILDAEVAAITLKASMLDSATAQLKKENLALEALIQPRSFTLAQQREIADALRPFDSRAVVVTSHAYDPEGYMFGQRLSAVFKSAQLTVVERPIGLGSVSGMGSFSTETGVAIGWPVGQKEFGVKIFEALDKIGRVRKLSLVPIQGPGEVWVTVNWKPFEVQ